MNGEFDFDLDLTKVTYIVEYEFGYMGSGGTLIGHDFFGDPKMMQFETYEEAEQMAKKYHKEYGFSEDYYTIRQCRVG